METTAERTRGGWKHNAPGEPTRGLERTPRVLGILHDLYDNTFMHSGHVKALHGGERIGRYLLRMAQHHLVVRVDAPWEWRQHSSDGGARPQVYALDEMGAYDLAAHGMISEWQWQEWLKKRALLSDEQRRKPRLLKHQLANADVKAAFHHDCAVRGWHLVRGPALGRGRNPRALIVPDRAHPLMSDDTYRIERESGRAVLVFVETDCATEPYARHDKNDLKSIERMFAGYLAYAEAGIASTQFGVEDFFVFTITAGDEKRVEGIASVARATVQKAGPRTTNAHLLTTNFRMLDLASPFTAAWMEPAGSLVTLAL